VKVPQRPPSFHDLIGKITAANRFPEILQAVSKSPEPDQYVHWDKLRHLQPPEGLSHEEWWTGLKFNRSAQLKPVPLLDIQGQPFRFAVPDAAHERLHEIDLQLGGRIGMPDQITNPATRDQYLVGSLIEEAITSSQLEGAATTREIAKDMLRAGRSPRDHSERMILNNYVTMQRIGKLRDKPLSRDLVLEVHRLVTDQTLDDPSQAGGFRPAHEERVLAAPFGAEVFHEPPPVDQLEGRMAAMCAFANDKDKQPFVHPVLRSIILHFWLAYDHPFVDGNGRTARALFYWSMLRHNYWLCEFISISEIIRKAPAKYGRAFLHTETDDNDLTYFLLYHLDVLKRAVDGLHKFVARKTRRLEMLERELRGMRTLNHRQRALISHALRHPHQVYTVESHRSSHNVSHQTALTDLMTLVGRGSLTKEKVGRTWHFRVVPGLERKLAEGD
jgi:Fic family protein